MPNYQLLLENENEGDISRVVDNQLQFLIHEGDKSVFDDIPSYLKKNARGVFLWISLIVKALKRKGWTISELEQEARRFPLELVDFYRQMVQRLARNDSTMTDETNRMLIFATFAERPLSVAEFRDVIAVPRDFSAPVHHPVGFLERNRVFHLEDLEARIFQHC